MRFPEFEGEWEVKKLGEVATNFMYGMNAAATVYDGENQYIRITDIDERTRLFIPNPLSSPDGELEDKYLLEKGDILFARTGASVGKSYLYSEKDGKIFFAGFLIRLNVKTENPYFIFSQTLTEKYQKWVLTMSMRSGQPGINAEEYKLLSIVIPSIQEQEKISSFLLLIDERIQTQSKIINDLKTLKIATAKKIFSGELRFKDDNGNDFSEWEDKKLGDISIKKSSNISANTLEENQGNFKIYGANGLLKEIDFYREEKPYIAIVKDGAGVGRLLLCEGKSSVLGTLDIIKNKEQTDLLFLYYLLETIDFTKFTTGSTIPHIYFKDYSKEIIGLPSFPEQTKIANFLSSIDSKIDIENQLLQKLEAQKKYLLQNMFV